MCHGGRPGRGSAWLYLHDYGLGFGEEFAAEGAAFAADAGVADPAVGCAQVADEKQLTHTVPARRAAETRWARCSISVNSIAFRCRDHTGC